MLLTGAGGRSKRERCSKGRSSTKLRFTDKNIPVVCLFVYSVNNTWKDWRSKVLS